MATIREALASAIRHHQAGQLQAAEQIYRRILTVAPDQPDALHLLGVIASQAGQHEVAIQYIGRAVRLMGTEAAFHNNLGNAFKGGGNVDEAVACYRRALELNPGYAEANNNLGLALQEQGNLDEAAACCRRALELKSDYAEAHNNLGITLQSQGKADEAVACCRRALELNPAYAEAHNNLGNVLRDQEKLNEAIACYRRALELKPDYAEVYNNLGAALHRQGRLDEAVACCRRALELKPSYAEAHNNLGSSLAEKGDLRGAEDCFRAALRLNSRLAYAHGQLARLLGGTLPEKDLIAQRRLLQQCSASGGQGGLAGAQRSFLHFGLAYVLDARDEYAEAAEHLDRGNAIQRSEWRRHGHEYDPQEHEFLVTRTIAVCTPDFFARVRGFGLEAEVPVFVVGLPRSGTTLVEQILASHSEVAGAGEITLVGDTLAALAEPDADFIERLGRLDRPTAQRLASRHLERLCATSRAALRVVDKTPENYLYLGLLASLFPRAKLIHCRRDLRDVAVSCWMTSFGSFRRWASDQQHIASRFHQYQRMMEHWRKFLPVPLLEVDYEETVADLEGVARKLVAWCGLAWEPSCLEFHKAKRPVSTASAVQVRQPVYTTSVGRWKHYEQSLATLLSAIPGGR